MYDGCATVGPVKCFMGKLIHALPMVLTTFDISISVVPVKTSHLIFVLFVSLLYGITNIITVKV